MCGTLTPDAIGGPVELTVADLSFISLRLVLPALAACTAADGDLVPMVKPQFEVGRERVGAGRRGARPGGCGPRRCSTWRRPPPDWAWGWPAWSPARCPGPSGNVEFFLWLRRGAPPVDEAAVRAAAGQPRPSQRDGRERRRAAAAGRPRR